MKKNQYLFLSIAPLLMFLGGGIGIQAAPQRDEITKIIMESGQAYLCKRENAGVVINFLRVPEGPVLETRVAGLPDKLANVTFDINKGMFLTASSGYSGTIIGRFPLLDSERKAVWDGVVVPKMPNDYDLNSGSPMYLRPLNSAFVNSQSVAGIDVPIFDVVLDSDSELGLYILANGNMARWKGTVSNWWLNKVEWTEAGKYPLLATGMFCCVNTSSGPILVFADGGVFSLTNLGWEQLGKFERLADASPILVDDRELQELYAISIDEYLNKILESSPRAILKDGKIETKSINVRSLIKIEKLLAAKLAH